MDDDVKEQLKKKGKDPHFGQEQVLFKLQDLLLEVSGPLMFLWSDLINPEAEVAPACCLFNLLLCSLAVPPMP